jgi:beta-mannosidase
MKKSTVELQWSVGHHANADATPKRFVPAQVPGAVQLDWARAESWPPHWFAENFRAYDWMEDCFWTYRAQIPTVAVGDGERLFFACQGVDYEWELWLDDEKLHAQEGMFAPFECELSPQDAGKYLRIRISPAPKLTREPRNRAQASHSVKPAVSYGWDWHPRLIPLGIWDETFLEVRSPSFLKSAEVFCTLDDDFGSAHLRLQCAIDGFHVGASTCVRWQMLAPDGSTAHEATIEATSQTILEARLDSPQLWWPHDHGTPALYTSRVELLNGEGEVLDEKTARVGLRRVRLVMHEGAWDWPSQMPKTRSNPPITLEINGRAIFSKGTNFVNSDIFPGVVTRESLRPLLDAAVGANMNLLRMWGGAPVQKEAFFEMCDEMGLMVWQEFPLACNPYPDDARYLQVLDAESRAIITRLRPHPSVVFWCGGNELFNSWSGMTDQSLPLRLLNKNCYELDAARPFLPTSPVMGMGHGHYVFYDTDNDIEAWASFQNAECTAYTEFGCPGPSPVEILKTFIPADELFPPRPGTAGKATTRLAFGWRTPGCARMSSRSTSAPARLWMNWLPKARCCSAKATRACSRKRAARNRARRWR